MRQFLVIVFLIVASPATALAETDMSFIDEVKQSIDTVIQSKSIKEESLKDYEVYKNIEEIDRSIRDYEIGQAVGGVRQFMGDSVKDMNMSGMANEVTLTMRDPFNLSGQTVAKQPGGFGFGSSFLPNPTKSKIPELRLRGIVHPDSDNKKELMALLEIGKKEVYMVKVGDEISYDPRDPNAAIKIIHINRLAVKVQAGSLGNVLIVR